MIKLIKLYCCYGITENGIMTVPPEHLTTHGAISEWEYWERLNANKQFLPHKRTIEEINKITDGLRNAIQTEHKPKAVLHH